MIKRLQYIKNYGVFKDFSWNGAGSLQDFKKKNIIYGWNYSGKTTLSRIFSSLQNKQLHEKYATCAFKIIDSDGYELTQDKLSSFNCEVRVFNSEYIRDTFKWDTNESMDAISFDIGENVKIREEIEKNKEKVERILGSATQKGRIDKYQSAIDEFSKFEGKYTTEASSILNNVFSRQIVFDKGTLKKVKSTLGSDYNAHLIGNDKDVEACKKASTAVNNKNKATEINHLSNLDTLTAEVARILKYVPQKTVIIDILDDNVNLNKWAKQGLELHGEEIKECAFCGNEISDERLGELNNYFSNAAAKLREEISSCRKLIEAEIATLDLLNQPKSKNDLSDNCQERYSVKIGQFDDIKVRHKTYLDSLASELDRKENGNIFNLLSLNVSVDSPQSELTTVIEDVNKILVEHNIFIDNFKSFQDKQRELLKKHCVAKFLIEEDYLVKESEKNESERRKERFTAIADKLNNKNDSLLASLKSVVAGKDALNKYIAGFLGREDVKVEVTSEDKFILNRGSEYADNLSEGEKTAVSFAYFLVTLESLHKVGKLKDTIIFIDDPISSLDSNHIAQVYSLINSFFFRNGIDPANLDKIVDCFEQIFISTHNFEFFSFLKDSSKINKKEKVPLPSGGTHDQRTVEYYLLQRNRSGETSMLPLPKHLKKKSEYIYLFELLYKYWQGECSVDYQNIILLPNALRRFLEIFTLIKLPDSDDEIDARISKLMGEPHSLKVLHHFSHFTSFEKLTRHDELILNLPQAMEELIKLLETDNNHFESLKRAVKA